MSKRVVIQYDYVIKGIGTEGIPVSLFLIRDRYFDDKTWYGKFW